MRQNNRGNMRQNNTKDITEKGAKIMVEGNRNLPKQLRQRDEELNALTCEKPKIRAWIIDFELPVLIKILNSPQEYFNKKFPEQASFSLSERQTFANEVEEHSKICKHCQLKVKHDLMWREEIEATFEDYRETVSTQINKTTTATPGMLSLIAT